MNPQIWLGLTLVVIWGGAPFHPLMAARPLGIDVSSYQGNIAWPSVAGAGISFAWAKATEGTGYQDAYFVGNQINGKAAGVFMGAYHYARYDLHTGTAGATAEADYFWNFAKNHLQGDGKTLMPMLDVEASPAGYTPATLAAWINQWCRTVITNAAAAGLTVKPVIYVSACHANYFDSSCAQWIPWIANYNGQNPETGTPWSVCSGYNIWGTWAVWQYTSSGSIPGIAGNVDRDAFNGTLDALVHTLVINGPATVVVPISKSVDDAEESASGVMNLTSTDLELVRDDGTSAGDQIVGLRFHVPVPAGAIITSASIQFTADETSSEPTVLDLQVEAADDASRFDINNLSGRVVAGTSVLWQPAPWLAVGQSNALQRSPDLTPLVQAIVSRPNWTSGNAMVFLVKGAGHRTADAFDDSGGTPPQLMVTYKKPAPVLTSIVSIGGSDKDVEQAASGAMSFASTDLELVRDEGAGEQTIGLRFENLQLPVGAEILSAHIQFSTDEISSEPTTLVIHAHRSGNAAVFTTNANNLTTRPLTINSIVWTPPPWNAVGERGAAQRTPDLAALVSEVIARPSWNSTNPLAFIISGSGKRVAESFDKAGGRPATLTIVYRAEPIAGSLAEYLAAAGVSNTNGPTAAPDADFDGDGRNNQLEHALGLNPRQPDLPAWNFSVQGAVLAYSYTRPRVVSDVSYAVEWSDTLTIGSWSSTGVTQQIVADNGTNLTVRAAVPAGAAGRRFVRLKITAGMGGLD